MLTSEWEVRRLYDDRFRAIWAVRLVGGLWPVAGIEAIRPSGPLHDVQRPAMPPVLPCIVDSIGRPFTGSPRPPAAAAIAGQ